MTVWLLLLTATTVIIQIDSLKFNDEPNLTITKRSSHDGLSQEDINRLAAVADLRFEDPLPDDIILPKDNLEGFMVDDMLFTQEQYDMFFNTSKDHSRKLLHFLDKPEMMWPDGPDGWPEIPYTFTNIPKKLETTVHGAFKHWHKHTCVKFKPVTNMKMPYVNIKFFGGCASRVGRIKKLGQLLGLANSCSLGNVIHELGHTLGFFHEHQRYDREEYIYVNSHNVMDKCGGRLRGCDPNFKEKTIHDMHSYSIPYDLGSIMHYGPKMFTNPKGHFTLGAKDEELTGLPGQRSRLSHRDIHLINKAYNCTGKWAKQCSLDAKLCINEGYLGSNCKCVCPPGTSGGFCEKKTGTYYDNVKPPCNRHITSPTTISVTSDDVHQLPEDVDRPAAWCVFNIEAPPCHKPEITITRFHIPDMYWRTKVRCKYAWVEFKEHYQTSGGKMHCGTELKPGHKIPGTTHKMSVFFNVVSGLKGYFSAEVSFKRDEHCDVMMDEALISSRFGKPITTGSCHFEMNSEGYVWRSSRKRMHLGICSFFFNEETEPFGLILKVNKTTSSSSSKCHPHIHYCYHERRCSVFPLNNLKDNSQLMLPSASAFFEIIPNDPRCRFELQINPVQTYCHKVMLVDFENKEDEILIDTQPGACQIWCKTLENLQVRVQINIYRNVLCASDSEWIEVSGIMGDARSNKICVENHIETPNVNSSNGYWYSMNSEDNHAYITMQYNASPETPIIVKCILLEGR